MLPSDPFLTAAAFASMFRPLNEAEKLQVTPLLQVVSDWIRDRKPNVPDDDPAAIVVTFEVTREALSFGRFGGLASFKETTSHSESSGTFGSRDVERFVTDRHREMLGITGSRARALGHFPKCDY